MSLAWILKGILDKLWNMCFHFLCQGQKDKIFLPWVHWERIATPKSLSGRGLKIIFTLSKSLVEKFSLNLIKTNNL
jgi:hypothetical protein